MQNFRILLLLFAVLSISCRKELENPSWDIDALIPIAYTDLTLFDVLEDSLTSTDENGQVSLSYSERFIEYKLDSLFTIPDTTTIESFSLPIGSISAAPGQTIYADTQETVYDLEDIALKYAIIQSGEIEVTLLNSIEEETILNYSLPSATLNGIPFNIIDTVPAASSSSTTTITKTYDISGYTIDFTGLSGNSYNTLVSAYNVSVSPAGNTVVISAGDYFQIEINYKSIVPFYAKGYFGNRSITVGPDSTALGLFYNIRSGTIDLTDATLEFTIENEIGADFSAQITELTAYKNTSTSTVSLDHYITSSTVNLTRAEETIPEQAFAPRSTTADVTSDNSNITEFISIFPDGVRYQIDFQINPLGNLSGGNDFIFYNTGITLSGDITIPLRFKANNVVLVDTTDFELDDDARKETNKINGGTLWLRAENDYPMAAQIQLVLLDSNTNSILDTLVTSPHTIEAAIVGSNGRTEQPAVSRIAIPVTPAKIDHLYNATSIIVIAQMNTYDASAVTVYEDYKLRAKLIGDFDYRIEIDEN